MQTPRCGLGILLIFGLGCAIAWTHTIPRDMRMAAAATYVGACERCTTATSSGCPRKNSDSRCTEQYLVCDDSGSYYQHITDQNCSEQEQYCWAAYDCECRSYRP
jgi:hypothetical protein